MDPHPLATHVNINGSVFQLASVTVNLNYSVEGTLQTEECG